jgi:TetR/AcrR family transcriptional repressor of lmrAB and yxaGH operons
MENVESRTRILEAAILLLCQSGLSGAGINQIVQTGRAPKGSMYHHFPRGKAQIVVEALEVYTERVAANLREVLGARRKPGEKLRGLFHHIAARFELASFDRSCAAGAAALDLDGSLPGVQEAVAAALLAWQQVIADHLPMKTSTRRLSFAGVVLSTIEGAYIRGRAERSATPFHEAGDWFAEMLNKGLK